MTSMRAFLVLSIGLVACGGGSSGTSSTTTTSGSESPPQRVGACYTESLGVCQTYYQGDPELPDAQTGCVESAVPGTSGAWLGECPSGGRLGDCNDVNGNLQARFFTSTQYPTAEAAETACEEDEGTWVPAS